MLMTAFDLITQVSSGSLNTSTSSSSDEVSGVFILAIYCCYFIFLFAFYAYISFSLMKIAEKTGFAENKILAWIPIANVYLMTKIAGKDMIWFILTLLFPIVGVVLWMEIAQKLGKESFWGILIIVPVVNLIVPGYLAFSNSDTPTVSTTDATPEPAKSE